MHKGKKKFFYFVNQRLLPFNYNKKVSFQVKAKMLFFGVLLFKGG